MTDITLFEDVAQHRLKRVHELERENLHLRNYRGQLERILGDTLRVATKNGECDELTLLSLLEDIDKLEQEANGNTEH